jgi:predicted acetyltransferase
MNPAITLIRPSIQWKEKALAFRKEFFENGEPVIFGSELLDKTESYEDWLTAVARNTSPKTVDPNWVVTDTFFAVDGAGEIVGIIDLRHRLNDFLKDLGHCGYSVRPSQRQKGYARQMLARVLEEARRAGLPEICISVERANLASVRVIEANGGALRRSFTHQGAPADVYAFHL